MKTRIQVLSVSERKGNKNGKDWVMYVCQCVAYPIDPDTGREIIRVGELVLPKGHDVVTPGDYDAEFGIVVGYDKQIGGRLVRLIPRTPRPLGAVSTGQVNKSA